MATLQEQIDTLRERLIAVQGSLASRALNSSVNSLNTQISTDLDTLVDKYDDLLSCVSDLQSALLAAREDLIELQET